MDLIAQYAMHLLGVPAHRPCAQLPQLFDGEASNSRRRLRDRPGDDATVHRTSNLRLHRQRKRLQGRPGGFSGASSRVRSP